VLTGGLEWLRGIQTGRQGQERELLAAIDDLRGRGPGLDDGHHGIFGMSPAQIARDKPAQRRRMLIRAVSSSVHGGQRRELL
jgi:hypothetical protein